MLFYGTIPQAKLPVAWLFFFLSSSILQLDSNINSFFFFFFFYSGLMDGRSYPSEVRSWSETLASVVYGGQDMAAIFPLNMKS